MTRKSTGHRQTRGFTLVELLVVIAIIGILAGLLMPALAKVKERTMRRQAQTEMQSIKAAIEQYYTDYSRYPTPVNSLTIDYTYGDGSVGTSVSGYGRTNNADLMAILLNENRLANTNNVKNPKRNTYLSVSKRAATTNSGGLGPDLVFRDPWGNPYFVSIDYNYDDQTADEVYSKSGVSQDSGNQGFNGLFSTNGSVFTLKSPVMVWSKGKDGQVNDQKKANADVNKDNVLGWAGN